jgi:hypothetical protein
MIGRLFIDNIFIYYIFIGIFNGKNFNKLLDKWTFIWYTVLEGKRYPTTQSTKL